MPQPLDTFIVGSLKLKPPVHIDLNDEYNRHSTATDAHRPFSQSSKKFMRPLSGSSSRPGTTKDDGPKFVELPFEKIEPSQTEKFLRDKKEKQLRLREAVKFAKTHIYSKL